MKPCKICKVIKPLDSFHKQRTVKSGVRNICKSCAAIKSALDYRDNPEKQKAWSAAWAKANPKMVAAQRNRYRKKNQKKENNRIANWCALNKEKRAAHRNKWRRSNMATVAMFAANRRASQLSATPKWANSNYIEDCYANAAFRTQRTGTKWHVDHIVPLQSKLVCGLHCEDNLRVIQGNENIRKGNRSWPDMP